MEVKSCRANNERSIRPHEKWNELNMKLMQSFNQLEKQMKDLSNFRKREEDKEHQRRVTLRRLLNWY